MGLACLVIAFGAPVEAALWGVEWGGVFTRWIGMLPGSLIAACLGGTWLVGAWLCDHLVGRRIHETLEPWPWFRSARALVAGFPGLGFASLPLWGRLATQHVPWAYSPRSAGQTGPQIGPMPERVAPPGPGAFSFFERSALLFWIGGIAVLLLAVTWLAAPPEPGALRRSILYAVAAMLHLLGFIGSIAYSRALRRRGGARRLGLVTACWVLPLPLSLAAFTPLVFDPSRARSETLVWAAHARRNQTQRLRRWAALEQSVRKAWRTSPWWIRWALPAGRPPRLQPTATDRQLLRLAGVKLSLALADGIALGWIALRAGGPDLGRQVWTALLALFIAAGAGIGILIAVLGHLAGAVHLLEPPRPLGGQRQAWSAAAAVGAVGLGALVGAALGRGDPREAGVLLVYGALAFTVVLGFGLFLHIPFVAGGSHGFNLALSWCGLFLVLMVVGGCVERLPGAATGLLLMALAAPLWHSLFFLMTRRRLESCLDLQTATLPAVASGKTRQALAVKLTAALPLGGLAVPWWLRLRDRRFGDGKTQA
jgi:hypothetical protein